MSPGTPLHTLRGAHAKIACNDCHKDADFKAKLPLTCIGCHKKDDVHKGGFGTDCKGCHNVTDWKQVTKIDIKSDGAASAGSSFDHDKTSFPLVGNHKQVACAKCHKTSDFKAAPTQCKDCHEDTRHKGKLGPKCEQCHSPVGWKTVTFNHNKQTKFPLTGAHVRVKCESCHTKPTDTTPKLSTVCGTCHQRQDVHRGRNGQNCGRCHSTSRF